MLKTKKFLKLGVILGNIIVFVDDLLKQSNNKQQTEQFKWELKESYIQGLHLNKNKSVIIRDHKEIKYDMTHTSNK